MDAVVQGSKNQILKFMYLTKTCNVGFSYLSILVSHGHKTVKNFIEELLFVFFLLLLLLPLLLLLLLLLLLMIIYLPLIDVETVPKDYYTNSCQLSLWVLLFQIFTIPHEHRCMT